LPIASALITLAASACSAQSLPARQSDLNRLLGRTFRPYGLQPMSCEPLRERPPRSGESSNVPCAGADRAIVLLARLRSRVYWSLHASQLKAHGAVALRLECRIGRTSFTLMPTSAPRSSTEYALQSGRTAGYEIQQRLDLREHHRTEQGRKVILISLRRSRRGKSFNWLRILHRSREWLRECGSPEPK